MKAFSMPRAFLPLALGTLLASLNCTTSRGTHALPASTGLVSLCFSGNGSEDWSQINCKVLSITLNPQGGTTPITLLAAPAGGIPFNLARLDHIGEWMGNFGVPVGSYTGATLSLSTASNDIAMSASSVPSADLSNFGFQNGTPTFIAVDNDVTSPAMSFSVPFTVPLVVTTNQTAILDLDWDSARPTFVLPCLTPGSQLVTLDFAQVLRQRIVSDPSQLLLLPVTGAVYGITEDLKSFTLTPSYQAGILDGIPVTLPQTLVVRPDTVNGTLFTDMATGSSQILMDLSTKGAALPGMMVRVGGQLQSDGSFLASRIWAGSTAMMGVELIGPIVAVDPATSRPYLDGEDSGQMGYIVRDSAAVTSTTSFTAFNPWSLTGSALAIGTGPSFLAAGNLFRGFLAHTIENYPLQGNDGTYTALDIESANFKGAVTSVNAQEIVCLCPTGIPGGTATVTLPFIAQGTPNGNDAVGAPISGFSWSTFSYPALIHSGPGAAQELAAASSASVDFGGSVGVLQAWATTHAAWANASNPTGWSAQYAVLEPMPLPLATMASAWTPTGTGGSFDITLANGVNTVTVDVLDTGATPTQLYQATTVSPLIPQIQSNIQMTVVDPSTAAGQTTLAFLVRQGASVQVYGFPQAHGHILAGIVICYFFND